jgi:hypothetical protein
MFPHLMINIFATSKLFLVAFSFVLLHLQVESGLLQSSYDFIIVGSGVMILFWG